MAQSLMHLPTKTATVKPEHGKPFIRQQHYNPNPDESAPEGQRGTETLDPATKLYLLKKRNEAPQSGEKHTEGGGGADTPLSEALNPQSRELQRAEKILGNSLPEELYTRNNFRKIGGDHINGVYAYQSDEGYQFYWKPREEELSGFREKNKAKIEEQKKMGELLGDSHLADNVGKGLIRLTVDGNMGGRELAAYDLSKLLGVEGLIPPSKEYKQQSFTGEDKYSGPSQMSAHDFGIRILGHDEVMSPGSTPEVKSRGNNLIEARYGVRDMLGKADNATDFVAFDFISGQLDRLPGNFFVAKNKSGRYNLIATDNGLSFPDHRGDILHPDSHNNFELQHDYFNSSGNENPMSQKLMEGVLDFNSKNFHEMASGHGISEGARNGVVDRITMVQNVIKNKYAEAMDKHPMENYNSVEERRAAIKKDIMITGNDISKMFRETVMNPIDKFGKLKYTPTLLEPAGQSRPDEYEENLLSVLEKGPPLYAGRK